MKYTAVTTFIVALLHVWTSASQNTTVHELELCHVEWFTCDDLSCDDLPKRESCSCLRSCTIFGDCCYGVEEYLQRCHESDVIQTRQKDKDLENLECIEADAEFLSQSYLMIAKCPDWWHGVDRCRSNETQTYGHFEDGGLEAIPVISLKTGVSYKNFFCAICNSESLDDLHQWEISAECSFAQQRRLKSMNVRESIPYILSRCDDARLAPPTAYIGQSLYFFPCYASSFKNMTDRCPENYTEGNFIPSNLSSLCEEIYSPLVVDDQLFKNQYCVECHFAIRPDQEVSFFECDQEEPPVSSVRGLRGSLNFSPISVTLDFHQLERTEVTLCKTGEIYDVLAQTCIRFNCQDGYYFDGNECTSIANRDKVSCNYTVLIATVRLSNNSLAECDVKLGGCWSKCLFDVLGLNHKDVDYLMTSTDIDEAGRVVVVVNLSVLLVTMQQYENVWLEDDFKTPDNSEDCKHIDDIDIVASCQSFEKHLCFSNWMTTDQFSVFSGGADEDIFGFLMGTDAESVQNFSLSEVKIKHTIHFSDVTEEVIHNRLYQVAFRHSYPCKDLTCEAITVDASSFVSVTDGSMTLVHVSDPSIRLTPDQYKRRDDGKIEVCKLYQGYGYHATLDLIHKIIYVIGTSLSVFALAFCVITYAMFPQLRTSISKVLTMVLCVNLLVATVSFAMVSWATISQIWCTGVAWAIHFFFLTTFSTSSIIGLHFIRTFRFKPRSSQTTRLTGSNIVANLAGCYGVPCIVSLTLVLCHAVGQNDRIRFGDETVCLIRDEYVNLWAFTIPAGTSVAFNTFAFIFVTLSIYFQTKGKKSLAKGQRKTEELKTFVVFFKISSLLGLTWLIGFLGILTNQSFIVFIFDILTPFQGFLLFVSFMCKRKTWKLWKQQLKRKVRPGHNATSTSKATSRTSPVTQRAASGRTGTTVTQLQVPYTIRSDWRGGASVG